MPFGLFCGGTQAATTVGLVNWSVTTQTGSAVMPVLGATAATTIAPNQYAIWAAITTQTATNQMAYPFAQQAMGPPGLGLGGFPMGVAPQEMLQQTTPPITEERRREIRGREEKQKAASDRARGLLISMLDEKERQEFELRKTISVRGASGVEYRITWGRTANIEVLDKARVKHRLCIHPEDPTLPIEDVMLSQLLHLKANENEVLRVANRHGA